MSMTGVPSMASMGPMRRRFLTDLADGDVVKAYWIWTVGRARREYASKLTARVRAWMNPQNVAAGAMKPS